MKSAEEVPKWLYDQTEFDAVKQSEIEAYELISHLIRELTSNRIDSKIKAIEDKFNDGKKVLVFDHCIVSLLYLEKLMQSKNVPCDLFIGTGGQKKKRVQLCRGKLRASFRPKSSSCPSFEIQCLKGLTSRQFYANPLQFSHHGPKCRTASGRVDRMNSLLRKSRFCILSEIQF